MGSDQHRRPSGGPATPAARPAIPSGPSPLWAVQGFTFLNSIGTGVVTNGIFFLTEQGYGFSKLENFALALMLGISYIVGALGAGPLLARLRLLTGVSARAVLAALMVIMAALCALPAAAQFFGGAGAGANGKIAAWPIWVLVTVYSPLTGMLWPIVESFLSGGRAGPRLRSAMGQWNIVWSSAIVVAYWGIAPLIQDHPARAILLLGLTHLAGAALLLAFNREPGRHVAEHHEPHPPVYRALLSTFRVLLPASYFVSSALNPLLPEVMGRFELTPAWATRLATSWLLARVVTFLVLERWQGWHGRWSMPIIGGGLLLLGFAASVVAPRLSLGPGGLALELVGLAIFGVGMATIYTGAIYYAMEVGHAQVEAAGAHEALIGVGYTAGPLCGIFASGGIHLGLIAEANFEIVVLATASAGALGVGASLARRAWGGRAARGAISGAPQPAPPGPLPPSQTR